MSYFPKTLDHDLEKLNELYQEEDILVGGFLVGDHPTTQHLTLPNFTFSHLKEGLEESLSIGVKGKGLDLGSGSGLVLLAMERVGIRSYGVEEDEMVASYSRNFMAKAIEELGWDIRLPEVKVGNYLDGNFSDFRFGDGTGIKDIDLFFCLPYEEYGSNSHACRMISLVESFGKTKSFYLRVLTDGGDPSVCLSRKEKGRLVHL